MIEIPRWLFCVIVGAWIGLAAVTTWGILTRATRKQYLEIKAKQAELDARWDSIESRPPRP